jgi:hypothetical protein
MQPGEIIALIAITLILGGAVWYIIKTKKGGGKCIGCPGGCHCNAKDGKAQGCHACSHCGAQEEIEEIDEITAETECSDAEE